MGIYYMQKHTPMGYIDQLYKKEVTYGRYKQ